MQSSHGMSSPVREGMERQGELTVVGIILKLGPVGVVLCGVGGPYCVALVFVGASIGAASAR